ncbi:MAG: Uma2 family endonuclease [Chloroflexi bacterium]|nr:Uma2 family endonuclease [Chloroflexota bacterium]
MALQPKRRRFTVADYHRMARAGILNEDDRVELIDGEVIEMPPLGPRHAGCVNHLTRLFVQALGEAAVVTIQNPVRLGQHDEPQPDVAILRPRADFYASRHPCPEDVFLLVEVAETSASLDRRLKLPRYAGSNIPEVWLVDLKQQTITAYRDPSPSGYRAAGIVRRGEQLAPAAFPDRVFAVAELLG